MGVANKKIAVASTNGSLGANEVQLKHSDSLQTTSKEIVGAINEVYHTSGAKSITYAELKALRDAEQLSVGALYRITDFVTTVANDPEARSAGHPFDLIVLALSKDTLTEEAYAIKSARDTDDYFANSNLSAWKVWYCLDNDATRFAWADEINGKGVIYRMIDEWQNDCPYDFKNVQFKRYKVEDDSPNGELADLDGRYIGYGADMMNLYVPDNNDFVWRYTFTNTKDDVNTDLTLNPYAYNPEEDYTTKQNGVGNIIQPTYCSVRVDDDIIEGVMALNNIVFLEGFDGAYQGTWGNEIKGRCVNMTFMSGSCSNIIESDNFNIIAGLRFLGNHIGVGGTMFSFSDNYFYNTFGNNCSYNTFGNGCIDNTFGDGCSYNTFGNRCTYNTFGDGCSYNTLFDGVSYISPQNDSEEPYNITNVQIFNGVGGTPTTPLVIVFNESANYTQMAGLNSDGELRVWTPADKIM